MKLLLEPLAPLEIELPEGGGHTIAAPTRDQVERVIALRAETEAGGFSLAEIDRRRRTELRLLTEPSRRAWHDRVPRWLRPALRRLGLLGDEDERLPIDRLHPGQVSEVLTALINHYFGNDPAGAVALDRAKKKALAGAMNSYLSSGATVASSASNCDSAPPKSDASASPAA